MSSCPHVLRGPQKALWCKHASPITVLEYQLIMQQRVVGMLEQVTIQLFIMHASVTWKGPPRTD